MHKTLCIGPWFFIGKNSFQIQLVFHHPIGGGKVHSAHNEVHRQRGQHSPHIGFVATDRVHKTAITGGGAEHQIQPHGVVRIVGQQVQQLVLHDIQNDKGGDAGQHDVPLELVADHAGRVQAQDGAGQRGQPFQHQEHHGEAVAFDYRAQQLGDLRPIARQTVHQVRKGGGIEGAEQAEHPEGQQHRQDAAQHPYHAGDQLGEDELDTAHRQGVHQVALAAQQVAGEALDDGEYSHDHDGNDQRQVDDHQHRNGGRVHQKNGEPERKPQQGSRRQNGQIQSAVDAAGGLELIF